MVRALHRSILGRKAGASFCSIKVQRTPRLPRSTARISPADPAPTMRTCVSGMSPSVRVSRLHSGSTAQSERVIRPQGRGKNEPARRRRAEPGVMAIEALLRLHARVGHHLAPQLELDLDELAELVGRAGESLEADGLEPRLDGGR